MNKQQSTEAQKLVSEYVIANPFLTYREYAHRFGLSYAQIIYILQKTGLHKKRGKNIVLKNEEKGKWVFVPDAKTTRGAGK